MPSVNPLKSNVNRMYGMRRTLPVSTAGIGDISRFELMHRSQKGHSTKGMRNLKRATGGTLSGGRLDKTKNKSALIARVKMKKKQICGKYEGLHKKSKAQLINLLKNP